MCGSSMTRLITGGGLVYDEVLFCSCVLTLWFTALFPVFSLGCVSGSCEYERTPGYALYGDNEAGIITQTDVQTCKEECILLGDLCQSFELNAESGYVVKKQVFDYITD